LGKETVAPGLPPLQYESNALGGKGGSFNIMSLSLLRTTGRPPERAFQHQSADAFRALRDLVLAYGS
jgi:hypothetical protein